MEAIELSETEYETWDSLVEESEQGTIFHKTFWLDSSRRGLGINLKVYGCFEGGRLVGGCSLFIPPSKFIKKAVSTVAMTPYGGIVFGTPASKNLRKNEELYAEIVQALDRVLSREAFQYVQIISSPDLIDVRPFTWIGWNCGMLYAYEYPLERPVEEVVSREVRWAARKAARSNVAIRKLELSDSSRYYELLSMTFQRQHRRTPVPKRLFDEIFKAVRTQDVGELWIATTPSGDIAAAEVIVWDSKRAYRWSAASHTDYKETGATSLLLCEILEDLRRRGFKMIDLMAANTPQLARFISAFNPKLSPRYKIERKSRLVKIGQWLYRAVRGV